MKNKKISRFFKSLTFGIVPFVGFNALIVNDDKLNKNSISSLELNSTNTESFHNLYFDNYDYTKQYDFYVTENTKKEIMNKVFYYIILNNWDFYYESVSKLYYLLHFFAFKYYVYIFTAAKIVDNSLYFNFYYDVRNGFCFTLNASDVCLDSAMQITENIKENYFTIKLNFIATIGGIVGLFESDSNQNITKPIKAMALDYDDDVFDPFNTNRDYIMYMDHELTLDFSNIRFHIIDDFLVFNNSFDINPFILRKEEINSLFTYKEIEPYSISYDTSSLINNDLLLKITCLSYRITTPYQDLIFHYIGNYELYVNLPSTNIITNVVVSDLNLYSLNEKNILEKIIVDEEYKKYISNVIIKKDFINNRAEIVFEFDNSKLKDLVFYDELKELFIPKTKTIDFGKSGKIIFDTSLIENNLIENFNIKNLLINFNDINFGIIELTNYEIVERDLIQKKIILDLYMNCTHENKTNSVIWRIEINNFLYYEFNNYETFIKQKFYLNDKLNVVELQNFFMENKNWKNIGTFSDDIYFKISDINEFENYYQINFIVKNKYDETIKNDSLIINKECENSNDITINNPENSLNKDTTNKFNKNYLYILLLLIPIVSIVAILLIKKIKQKKKIIK